MKSMIPWFCLAAITQSAFAQTGMTAYREGDYATAAALFKAQTTLDPTEEYYLGQMYLYGYGVLKSNGLALRFFHRAAERGLLDAQLLMGRIELMQNANPEQALMWFKKAAAANDVSAQLYCAGAYLFGVGVKKNVDLARNYFIAAARAGNSIAQHTLAANFLETHQSANKKLGLVWLEKSLAQHDPEAEIMMAELCSKGELVSQNLDQAKKLTEEAIAKNYIPAYYQMGRIELAQSHPKEAQAWYLKAADAKFIPAQIALAQLYLDPKSELYAAADGFLWMLKAAQSGSAEAQHNVGLMYKNGEGVEKNDSLAMEWEKKALISQQGSAEQAEQNMVQWLTHGKATRFNDTAYRLPGIFSDWHNHAALQDNVYNQYPKMNALTRSELFQSKLNMIVPNEIPINQYYDAMVAAHGNVQKETLIFPQYPIKMTGQSSHEDSATSQLLAHREGYDYLTTMASSSAGVEYHKIYEQLLNQAILGDSTAQFDVAQMYQQGLGVEKSTSEAIKFYQMAAAQNDLPSEYQLGLLYLQGDKGLDPDYQIAMEWLTDAAYKGDAYAQYALARIYEQGFEDATGKEVIPAFPEQSNAMYQLASANHYGVAQYRLADIMVRDKPKDMSMSGLETRRMMIKRLYQGAADYGVDAAKLPLAFYYAMDSDPTKQAQAFADAQQAAKAGSIDAAFLLGIMYDRGIATEPSREQAIQWYEKAANNPMSAFILGTYASEGIGMDKNLEKANEYLQFSVDKEFAAAHYNMAVLKHQQGQPFLPYLDKAIVLGSSRAGLELADYNMAHVDDAQKLKQAHDLYERFAKQGDQSAQVKLGYMYEQGLGTAQDYNQALTWYTTAAEQGHAKAQYLLGRLYQLGFIGKQPDYAMAKQWYALAQTHEPAAAVAYGFIDEMIDNNYVHALNEYQQAIDLTDPVASYNLGLIYEMGKSQPIDLERAKELYQQAAAQGIVKAMVALGGVYLNEKKADEALTWLQKAADKGDADAEYQLGFMNEKGLGIRASVADAVKYYQQSAQKGNAKATLALARLYHYGLGIDKNTQQAAQYYTKLAQQDNSDAQYQLALFCLSGDLSDCNEQQGKVWLQKAQDNGCRDAGRMLRLYAAHSQNSVSYIESVNVTTGKES